MDPHEKDIWAMAGELIARHGENAANVAHKRVCTARHERSEAAEQVWLWIEEAVEELLRERERHDALN